MANPPICVVNTGDELRGCNEDILLHPNASGFVSHILLCSRREKVRRHHGDMVGSASRSNSNDP